MPSCPQRHRGLRAKRQGPDYLSWITSLSFGNVIEPFCASASCLAGFSWGNLCVILHKAPRALCGAWEEVNCGYSCIKWLLVANPACPPNSPHCHCTGPPWSFEIIFTFGHGKRKSVCKAGTVWGYVVGHAVRPHSVQAYSHSLHSRTVFSSRDAKMNISWSLGWCTHSWIPLDYCTSLISSPIDSRTFSDDV